MKTALSPKQLALAIGVSESSLRRWTDDGLLEVTRTAGGHRRIALLEALRFIRERRFDIVRPDVLGVTTPEQLIPIDMENEHPATVLTELLMRGNSEQAINLLQSAYLRGQRVCDICDQLVAPALRSIGELWQHNDDGIFIEHRAVDLCVQAVNHIRALMPFPDKDAPVAVGGAPTGDPYMLSSMIAAAVLSEQGWQSFNLGPDTPLEVLASSAERQGAALIWVTMNATEATPSLETAFRTFTKSLQDTDTTIVVGGRTADRVHGKFSRQVVSLTSMSELASYAMGLSHRQDVKGMR